MKQTPRREFLAEAIGAPALAAIAIDGAGAEPQRTPEPKPGPDKFFTPRMEEMTSREIEFYLKDGGDLVFVPFGPISGHGAFIPVGMHAHWAHALSVVLARKAGGLVFPPCYACYAGATRSFRGTVSFEYGEQVSTLKRIALRLYRVWIPPGRASRRNEPGGHRRDDCRSGTLRRDRETVPVSEVPDPFGLRHRRKRSMKATRASPTRRSSAWGH